MTAFTTPQAATPEVEAYVRRCLSYFDDLPVDEQLSLEHDVREIVAEVSAELDGDPADLVGPPQRFAAELRSAAGLPPRAQQSSPNELRQVMSTLALPPQWLRSTAVPWCRQLACDLRPAWWVARGFGLAILFDPNHLASGHGLVPNLLGSNLLGLIATVFLVVGSVQLGRTWRPDRFSLRIVTGFAGVMGLAMIFSTIGEVAGARFVTADYATDVVGVADPSNEVYINILDGHTHEVLFSRISDSSVGLVEAVAASQLDSPNGFFVDYYGPESQFSGRVATWDQVVAMLRGHFDDQIAPVPQAIVPIEP